VHDPSRFLKTLSEFARTLVSAYEVDTVLAGLTEQVSAVLALCSSGVTLDHDQKHRLVTALSPAAEALEQCQFEHRRGPCLEAYRTGKIVLVADLRNEVQRWPEYAAVAARHGVVAVAGIPLRLVDDTVGALNLYADQAREWSAEDIAAAGVLGDMATSYVINASKLDQQRQLNHQLKEALSSRIIIEQAKGITANAHQATVDVAFELMRRHARNHNTSLQRVAEAIVHAGLRV
jgi:GAF domain-containing protein